MTHCFFLFFDFKKFGNEREIIIISSSCIGKSICGYLYHHYLPHHRYLPLWVRTALLFISLHRLHSCDLLRWSSWRRTGRRAGETRRSCWSSTVWTLTETRPDSSSTPSNHTWLLWIETFSAQESSSITSGYDDTKATKCVHKLRMLLYFGII